MARETYYTGRTRVFKTHLTLSMYLNTEPKRFQRIGTGGYIFRACLVSW